MSSIEDVCSGKIDLRKLGGPPKDLTLAQYLKLYSKGLSCSNSDIRYAALKRLTKHSKTVSKEVKAKILSSFRYEKDPHVLSALVDMIVKHKINEALLVLVSRYDKTPYLRQVSLYIIERLMPGRAAVPLLMSLYKKNPSRRVALALLRRGEQNPYLSKYSKADLRSYLNFGELSDSGKVAKSVILTDFNKAVHLFVDPERENLVFKEGITIEDIEKCPISENTKKILTNSLFMFWDRTPQSLSLMVDVMAGKHDRKVVPIILELLDLSKTPVAMEKLVSAFGRVVTERDFPLLFDKLKKHNFATTADFILRYLEHRLKEENLPPKLREKTILALAGCLKHKNYMTREAAAQAFGRIKDKMAVPYLLKALPEKEGYASVKAAIINALGEIGDKKVIPQLRQLVKVSDNASIVLPLLKNLKKLGAVKNSDLITFFKHKNFNGEIIMYTALELAKRGSRGSLDFLIMKFWVALELSPLPREELVEMHEAILNVIKPKDTGKIKRFLKGKNFASILFALDCLKRFKDPKNVALIVPLLKPGQLRIKLNDRTRTQIKLNALQALIECRRIDDTQTLTIIEEQKKYLEKLLQDRKTHLDSLSFVAAKYGAPKEGGLKNVHPLLRMRARVGVPALTPSAWALPEIADQNENELYNVIAKVLPGLEKYIAYSYQVMRQRVGISALSEPKK
ncbi:MAG: HEAT repeat domain-containing protein [Candidatus Saganbacteria bacterium]|nr:HEAT repeat domain-containing protein [Candidatus Saganbacteria bacterium]